MSNTENEELRESAELWEQVSPEPISLPAATVGDTADEVPVEQTEHMDTTDEESADDLANSDLANLNSANLAQQPVHSESEQDKLAQPRARTKSSSRAVSRTAAKNDTPCADRNELEAVVMAIDKSMATIEFSVDGTVLTANTNFLNMMGYSLAEIQGRHHGLFVPQDYRQSEEYREFWQKLRSGQYQSAKYKSVGNNGREVWIQASYQPVSNTQGIVDKVIQFAIDVTPQKLTISDLSAQVAAIGKFMAVVEFNMDGTVRTANDHFLAAMGYRLDEIRGKHDSMFVDDTYRRSPEYREFWEGLNRGEYRAGEYKRLGKSGSEVWIQASYNPIPGLNGQPFKVVQYATLVTQHVSRQKLMTADFEGQIEAIVATQKLTSADYEGQISAIQKSAAVIEFSMDGTILAANSIFLKAMGYELEEIKGKQHSIFVDETYRDSSEYREFWEKLNRGEHETGEYKRLGKDGREVWIQASYNPILDRNGKPFKVVKYATDVTQERLRTADFEGQISAIQKSTAVIEFSMDGTILAANSRYLAAMGYRLDEIQGKHHSIFVDEAYRNSREYRAFWEKLNNGEYHEGEYKRLGKDRREVWIQASYNPILDLNGKPFKVVKYATDVTQEKLRTADFEGQISAIQKSTAVIEFSMDGTILAANSRYLTALGYRLDEIQGKHHSIFVDEAYRNSREYRAFWEKLNNGEYHEGEYKRLGKDRREVCIQASYNPILDLNGRPFKVVKYATINTEQRLLTADLSAQMAAIGKSQAVIEFDVDGIILSANDNFLETMGYTLAEIKGRHHGIFVDDQYRSSREYQEFWESLKKGEHQTAEFKRLGKGGREVWIQASYNPILDLNGKPFKVVKFATEITKQKLMTADFEGQIAAIGKSQAVIEFDVDGIILSANDNFLNAVGYTLGEIKGKHHSMFVEEAYKNSSEYREFWSALKRGEYQAGVYRRIGKGGREVWLQASYNTILDLNVRPFKIVKYATEVTDHIRAQIDLQHKVEAILGVVRAASEGDLTQEIPVNGSDAIGQMGEGLSHFFKALRQSVQHILRTAHSLGQSAEKLITLSSQMAGNAGQTASQAKVVSDSSGEVSRNISVMATGGTQMMSSIRLIAGSSHESARVAKEAVSAAASAKVIVSELGDSSTKIGNVLKLITSIAQQTNLLALNATIEAARAGEAGKGFAVVAHEVKELAKETAKATNEIGLKIEAIQSSTKSAVMSIGQIDSVIHQIDQISASIASAVEQQTATTNEMGRSVNEAASGADNIAQSILGVARTAQNTTVAADETRDAANAMAAMATQLQSLVGQFKI